MTGLQSARSLAVRDFVSHERRFFLIEFCKAYNAATESQRGNVVPVEITVYEDRSFDFKLKTPPAG